MAVAVSFKSPKFLIPRRRGAREGQDGAKGEWRGGFEHLTGRRGVKFTVYHSAGRLGLTAS